MALTAQLYREQDERIADRQAVNLGATVRQEDQRPIDVSIDDLSTTGFRMQSFETMAIDSTVSVGIAGLGRHTARIVRQDGNYYGCRFVRPVSIDGIAAAGPPQNIVRADFGQLTPPPQTDDPPLDALELRIRQFRGPIIVTGLVVPWLIIAAILTALN